jgi:Xaa-Pro aminopeptidase
MMAGEGKRGHEMSAPNECTIKEEHIQAALARLGFDSLILTRRDNFAWVTGGGRAISGYAELASPVYLVFSPRGKFAVGYSIDLLRTADEELAGLGYETVSLPSFGRTPAEVALALTEGRVAADAPCPGAEDISGAITKLHEPYTPAEMARYEDAAHTSGRILAELARWLQPGMTERQVMAHAWEMFVSAGHEGRYMFLGSDERIRKYRHAVFSDKPIERCVLLAPCTARWGLIVPASRLVYFGEPPEEIRRRYLAVATMQAAMLASARPGVRLTRLREIYLELFDRFGYSEEKTVHFHGGPVSYGGSYADRCLDPEAVVQACTAFAFYFTVAGAKSEELMLVDANRTWLASVVQPWPTLEIEFAGQRLAVPDILVR